MQRRVCSTAVTGLLLLGLWGAWAAPLTAQPEAPPPPASWQQIDNLNDAKDFDGAFALLELLAGEYGSDVEYLWRRARHHFNVSDNTTDEALIEQELYRGLEFARAALAADSSSSWAHGYHGILIGRVGEIEGTKQKIINSYAVRDNTMRAIALDPEYAGWQHVMGRWHYALSDLSWIERTVASIVYETPPAASFEEAEQYFARSAQLAPDDIRHFLWLGKTRLQLGKDAQARASLEQAVALPAQSDSDAILQEEARELLD